MIKVLFVYKGSGVQKRNSVIDAQADSIKDSNVDIIKFPLNTKGILSYFKEFFRLRKYLKSKKIDLIHSHYSYSGIISALTGKKTICSLMGSDVFDEFWFVRPITWFFNHFVWKSTIVKSKPMQGVYPKSEVIPNGINFELFKPIDRFDSHKKLGFKEKDINIIFIAEDVHGKVKNLSLAEAAMDFLPSDYKLHPVSGVTQNNLVNYYNAADVLLMTSLSEGSPNVVKEAMACNCPVVSTDVGDVSDVVSNTIGCFISEYDPKDIANKIILATKGKPRTTGRENISHLNSDIIANRLIELYKSI